MGKIRKPHIRKLNQFVSIPNEWARDKNLTFKARGLLTYLHSHKEGWSISINNLVADCGEGRQAVEKAVAELEQHGYLARKQVRTDSGQMLGMDYVLTDPADEGREVSDSLGGAGTHRAPVDGLSASGSDADLLFGNPLDGNPVSGNQHTQKTSLSEEKVTKNTSGRKTAMPANWTPNESSASRAKKLGLDLDDEAENFKLWTEMKGYKFANWDSGFMNHLKRSSEKRQGTNASQAQLNRLLAEEEGAA